MAVTSDILRSYRHPRRVMRELLAQGRREDRALAFLMLGCGLMFVAQWPALARAAELDPSVPLQARIGGALVGAMFMLPLLMYLLAGLVHLGLRTAGWRSGGYSSRLALFWAFLSTSPLALFHGLLRGLAGPGAATQLVGVIVLGAFLALWIAGLREAALEPGGTRA